VAPPKPPDEPAARRRAGEDAAVERIRRAHAPAPGAAGVLVGIGDDAAAVRFGGAVLLLSTDAVLGGVHADLDLVGLDDLGWKALNAAVSDIGAMGGSPRHALVTCCVPTGTDLDRLMEGVAAAARATGCALVGGDLSVADQVVVSVAVTGALEGDAPPVTRSGGAAGDTLFVTGPLGASAAGLRHLRDGTAADWPGLARAYRRPVARLAEGVAARHAGASAAIDVSDGLAIDVDRLGTASGVGVALDLVPVAPGSTEAEALGGGEDYELVIATPDPDRLVATFARAGLRPPVRVGSFSAALEERTVAGRPLARVGWEHPVG